MARLVILSLKNAHPQTCLGDVLLEFCARWKVVANYLSNYPVTLNLLDHTTNSQPKFRKFLAHREMTPAVNMLSLCEILAEPLLHIGRLARLTARLDMVTPPHHADKNYLERATAELRSYYKLIEDTRHHLEDSGELKSLHDEVEKCPDLREPGRRLICREDVALLRPRASSLPANLRVYEECERLTLVLLSDSILVCERRSERLPFSPRPRTRRHFAAALPLFRLTLTDVRNTKYIENAISIKSSRFHWLVGFSTSDAKLRFASCLASAIETSLREERRGGVDALDKEVAALLPDSVTPPVTDRKTPRNCVTSIK